MAVDEALELSTLAAACWLAAGNVAGTALTPTQVAELRAAVATVRGVLLPTAVGLAAKGLLPAEAVAAIQRGRGPFDAALDVVQLAALLTDHWSAVQGKVPITAGEVAEAAAAGQALADLLRPGEGIAAMRAPTALDDARQLRDGLWTLLRRRHRDLRRCGMYLWDDEVDAHVPALQARKR